mmetsp:Transcript_1312/g.2274  ORF Transcript_1312/g.2274 Transcript_1312/m.2274 type:complete len:717 (+) Transcript_1312:2347-4497(+)
MAAVALVGLRVGQGGVRGEGVRAGGAVAVALGRELLRERPAQQEHGHRDEDDQQDNHLHAGLARKHGLLHAAGAQHDADQRGDEVGRLAAIARAPVVQEADGGHVPIRVARVGGVVGVGAVVVAGAHEHAVLPVDGPLDEDQQHHVAEHGQVEDQHGHKLQPEPNLVLEVNAVQATQAYAKGHVDDADDHRGLHLHGVEEQQLIVGHVPGRITPKRVHRVGVAVVGHVGGRVGGVRVLREHGPLGPEQVQPQREVVVVHQPAVHRVQAHQEDHVPGLDQGGEAAAVAALRAVAQPEQVQPQQQHAAAVANVPVHHAVHEGEGGGGEERGVGLLVPRGAVRVHELLEGPRELVQPEVGGRGGPGLGRVLDHGGHLRVHAPGAGRHGALHLRQRVRHRPALRREEPAVEHLEEVERVVGALLAQHGPLPLLQLLRQPAAQRVARVPVLLQHLLRLLQLHAGLLLQARAGARVVQRRHPVAGGPEGVADLVDLGLDGAGLEEDHEDHLVHHLARGRVRDGRLDFGEPRVAVAACGPEEHALEAPAVLLPQHARDVLEAHVRVPAPAKVRVHQRLLLDALAEGVERAAGGARVVAQLGHVAREEVPRLAQHLVQLHLLVELNVQGLGELVQLEQLGLLLLEVALEHLQKLRPFLARAGGAGEVLGGSDLLDGNAKLFDLRLEIAELPLKLIAASDVAHVPPLESSLIGVQIGELDYAHTS